MRRPLKAICLRMFPATPRTSEIVDSQAGLREIPHRAILSSKSHRIVGNRIRNQSHSQNQNHDLTIMDYSRENFGFQKRCSPDP